MILNRESGPVESYSHILHLNRKMPLLTEDITSDVSSDQERLPYITSAQRKLVPPLISPTVGCGTLYYFFHHLAHYLVRPERRLGLFQVHPMFRMISSSSTPHITVSL